MGGSADEQNNQVIASTGNEQCNQVIHTPCDRPAGKTRPSQRCVLVKQQEEVAGIRLAASRRYFDGSSYVMG